LTAAIVLIGLLEGSTFPVLFKETLPDMICRMTMLEIPVARTKIRNESNAVDFQLVTKVETSS